MESFLAAFLLTSCLMGLSTAQEMSSSTMHGMVSSTPSTMMGAQMVDVTVYYETLCPDSIKFVTKQVAPLFMDLDNNIKLTLVPFGKGNASHDGSGYTFTCHHGEPECYGNRVHACVLNSDLNEKQKLNFINCTMATVNRTGVSPGNPDTYPGKSCFNELKISEPYGGIESCASGDNGNKFLYEEWEKTKSFQNPLMSVPSATVMGTPIKIKDYEKGGELKMAVCGKFEDKNAPKVCKSGAQMTTSVLLLTLLAVAFSRILA